MLRLLLLSIFFVAVPVLAADEPKPVPNKCPQCGEWKLHSGSGGLTGEVIRIGKDKVEIPAKGEFCVASHKTTADPEGRNFRYRVILALRSRGDCNLRGTDTGLTLHMEISTGWRADAGSAVFELRQKGKKEASFTGAGWNAARDDPCDSGASEPSLNCLTPYFAENYQRLAYAALEASRGFPKQNAKKFADSFNLTKFAREVEAFCDIRDGQQGAFEWPAYWSLECQNERIDVKLREIDNYLTCRSTMKEKCKVPDHRFDRSERQSY